MRERKRVRKNRTRERERKQTGNRDNGLRQKAKNE